jgi:hypothetical protein
MKVIIDGEIYISLDKVKQRLHKNLMEEMKYSDSEEEKHGIEIADANVIVVLERMQNES